MPRPLVIGNGSLLINLDRQCNLRDLYHPYVGMDNHIGGHRCGVALWEGGRFTRIEHDDWVKQLGYRPDSLVTEVVLRNTGWGLELVINDAVHYSRNLLLRRLCSRNLSSSGRKLRVFFDNDFSLFDNNIGDTVLYDPLTGGVIHYKRNLYLLMNGTCQGRGVYQYACGLKRFGRSEGTWRDAEDGRLEKHPIAHGSVDSTLSFLLELSGNGEEELWYWIAIGGRAEEVREINRWVLEREPEGVLEEIDLYWRHWVNRRELDFGDLSERVQRLYKRSLLVVRTHCDNRGGILAATDTDIMATARDHYNYVWFRDAALIAVALDQAGYGEVALRSFSLAASCLSEDGYYYQKYHPDGSLGSSWHPWVVGDRPQLPIQEDETALVLYALWHHYHMNRDLEAIEPLYLPLVKRAADFLVSYRQCSDGLPLESTDLWEERRGIFSFTCSAIYAGLEGAASLAELLGRRQEAEAYHRAALEVRAAMEEHLYSSELGRFLRGIYPGGDGYVPDHTLDASLSGIFMFGALAADDPRVIRTMEAVREGLMVRTLVGGLARYTGDWYFRRGEEIPGNPWIITTLWLAQWEIAKARSLADLSAAREILEWTVEHALESGILSEQLDPYNGEPLSVAPLTWSHGTYIQTVLSYLSKYHSMLNRTCLL